VSETEQPAELDRDRLVWVFTQMLRIREFEERVKRTFEEHPGVIRGHTHLADGAEASIVGSIAALREGDQLMATYRCHGYPIALGTSTQAMMAEIYGKKTGLCGGFGGSMHLVDVERGFLGTSGIVAQGIPHATGAAWAAQIRKEGQVVLCFFGDGASKQGAFHESLNIASLWRLPIVFVCENNQYAANNTVGAQHPRLDIAAHAAPYDMPGVVVDGNDVLEVHAATGEAVARARRGGGPSLLECKTYRWHFHAMRAARPPETRPAEEIASWKARDPIARLEQHMIGQGLLAPAELQALRDRVAADLDAAVAFADASPFPDPKDLLADMFAA
jgi:TPP-dependent pyruvate/acetoin dehydrogenase alpha subunit